MGYKAVALNDAALKYTKIEKGKKNGEYQTNKQNYFI